MKDSYNLELIHKKGWGALMKLKESDDEEIIKKELTLCALMQGMMTIPEYFYDEGYEPKESLELADFLGEIIQ